jgi:hypothetical protein
MISPTTPHQNRSFFLRFAPFFLLFAPFSSVSAGDAPSFIAKSELEARISRANRARPACFFVTYGSGGVASDNGLKRAWDSAAGGQCAYFGGKMSGNDAFLTAFLRFRRLILHDLHDSGGFLSFL